MDEIHQEIINEHMRELEKTDLNRLVPKLISNNVFNHDMIERIFADVTNPKLKAISLFLDVCKRGPQAFSKLVMALCESEHTEVATMLLKADDAKRHPTKPNGMVIGSDEEQRENMPPRNTQDSPDSMAHSGHAHVCQIPQPQGHSSHMQPNGPNLLQLPPAELRGLRYFMKDNKFRKDDMISLAPSQAHKRWDVRNARDLVKRPVEDVMPEMYRMMSNPRGFALIINNIKFDDSEDFPVRNGALNDGEDMTKLLKQLYFVVEYHPNKTRQEMVSIVEKFSQKEEWSQVDCAFVVVMSHGKEGESEEDTEIVGTDGIGFKTRDILSYFYNDCCPGLHNKPKIFIFQSCRGNLTDRGVDMYYGMDDEAEFLYNKQHRTETDGRRMTRRRARSRSDIFIAHPVPPGMSANRDKFDGAWFIQAIVEVFSKYARVCDLEDLFKIVDNSIKNLLNPKDPNYQSVTTRTVGWNKKLYFNPGLYYLDDRLVREDDGEGMDVVDTPSDSQSHCMKSNDLMELTPKEEDTVGCFSCRPC